MVRGGWWGVSGQVGSACARASYRLKVGGSCGDGDPPPRASSQGPRLAQALPTPHGGSLTRGIASACGKGGGNLRGWCVERGKKLGGVRHGGGPARAAVGRGRTPLTWQASSYENFIFFYGIVIVSLFSF